MNAARLPADDPRTIARDIPGILDNLFPQLTSGVVAHFNRKAVQIEGCTAIPQSAVDESSLQRAMLFELAVAAGEQLIAGVPLNWDTALALAISRQRRHFDAQVPQVLTSADIATASAAADNLARMMSHCQTESGGSCVVAAPTIAGFRWIASSSGDFAVGTQLVEVKCSNRRFSAADYRQILMYWLLSYASSVEKNTVEWTHAILLNPRLNLLLKLSFMEIADITSAGRSKVELLGSFASMVGERTGKALSQ